MIKSFLSRSALSIMKLGNRCYVHESAVLMGDIELEDDCSVWPKCSLESRPRADKAWKRK